MPIKLDVKKSYSDLINEIGHGVLSENEYDNYRQRHGLCQIEVPYKGVPLILFEDIITPFYLFQVKFPFEFRL